VATGVTTTSYTATSLVLGTIYEWTVEARNSDGFSIESSGVEVLHAIEPEQPIAPTTT
jgi:hypothetical protein